MLLWQFEPSPVTYVTSGEVKQNRGNWAILKRTESLNESLDILSEKYVSILDMLFS